MSACVRWYASANCVGRTIGVRGAQVRCMSNRASWKSDVLSRANHFNASSGNQVTPRDDVLPQMLIKQIMLAKFGRGVSALAMWLPMPPVQVEMDKRSTRVRRARSPVPHIYQRWRRTWLRKNDCDGNGVLGTLSGCEPIETDIPYQDTHIISYCYTITSSLHQRNPGRTD